VVTAVEVTEAAVTAEEIAEATVRNSVDAADADVLVAVAAVGDTVVEVEAAVVDSARVAGATCLLRSTLPRKAQNVAVTAARNTVIAETTEEMIAVVIGEIAAAGADIRNAAATIIAVRAATSTGVRRTLRALPRRSTHRPKNLLCCPANRWPNIAHAR
jgi:hypothetical protein